MKLVKKYFSDHREWFLRAGLALVVLVVLAYMPALTRIMEPRSVIDFMEIITFVAFVTVTVRMTMGYVRRQTGVIDMLTPAPAIRKFMLVWIVSMPCALAVIVAAILAVNTLLHHTTGVWISNVDFFEDLHPSWSVIEGYLSAACMIHGMALLGALTVSAGREGFWRRAFVGVVVFAVACILIVGLPGWLGMPDDSRTDFPFFLRIEVTERGEGARLFQTISWASDGLRRVLSFAVKASVPVVLWIAAWFKFKELEVR